MDKSLALEFVRVTEEAAIAAAKWMGKGDKNAADGAAVDVMRRRFNYMDIDGKIVIGEGEMDEAPMLFIGEKVGTGKGMKIDIAVDPLECTNSVAYGRPNAISVMAAAPHGCLLGAPDMYMNKIAVGPKAAGKIDLDYPIAKNIQIVAESLGKDVEDVNVMVLDRERHKKLIQDIREAGARISLITDGDISAAVAPSMDYSGVDILVGIGGAPEGVIAAAAIKCMGGDIQGRLHFMHEEERRRAKDMGLKDPDKKFMLNDLAKGDSIIFAATGINSGPLLKGIEFNAEGAKTYSVVMREKSKTIRFVETIHRGEHAKIRKK